MRRRERGDLEEDDVPGLEGLLPGLATALHQSQQMRQVQHNLMFKIKSQSQRGFLEEGCFNSRGTIPGWREALDAMLQTTKQRLHPSHVPP